MRQKIRPGPSKLRCCLVLTAAVVVAVAAQRPDRRYPAGPAANLNQILGRPTASSVTLSVLAADACEAYVEYGLKSQSYTRKTAPAQVAAGVPGELTLSGLQADTRYFYRLQVRRRGGAFTGGPEYSFHTQRAAGSAFTFAVQGDSHPERNGRMYDPALYVRTLQQVVRGQPDFYLTLGDDFSLQQLITRDELSAAAVDEIYAHQRGFLGLVGSSAPLFLVNGNHEEAALTWLDGTPNNPAVLAGRARNRFYPLPAPDAFYSGDTREVPQVGLLRDYYAWTWGDALFVVLDPYWHSPAPVDSAGDGRYRPEGGGRGNGEGRGGRNRDRAGGGQDRQGGGRNGEGAGGRQRDWWGITIGDEQYHWLKTTLEQSQAKYKFVFAHHVMGTGRGAVEMADLYEWGGQDRNGSSSEFSRRRPGWAGPIHQLMVKNGVTIFFQGHDHLFARQEKDGLIYQEAPNPADATYTAFNREAYRSGDIRPNAGHLRVTVSPASVRVEYVRSFLPQDEKDGQQDGAVAFSYTVAARAKASK